MVWRNGLVERKVMNSVQETTLARWRLVLGQYAKDQLGVGLSVEQQRIENALDFLYSREYRGRGVRGEQDRLGGREGTLDPSQLPVPRWLSEIRELFPKQTVAV